MWMNRTFNWHYVTMDFQSRQASCQRWWVTKRWEAGDWRSEWCQLHEQGWAERSLATRCAKAGGVPGSQWWFEGHVQLLPKWEGGHETASFWKWQVFWTYAAALPEQCLPQDWVLKQMIHWLAMFQISKTNHYKSTWLTHTLTPSGWSKVKCILYGPVWVRFVL